MITDAEIRMNMIWKTTIQPTCEPVSVEEVKEYARIDGSEEDNLLTSLIESSRIDIENFLGKALINRTVELTFDNWPSHVVLLPMPPLVSITSVETTDEDDTDTTYAATNYYIRTEAIPGELIIKKESTLPTNTERDIGGYKITYIAGYGTNPEQVPAPIRKALKEFVTEIYEKRIPTIYERGQEKILPPNILKLLIPIRNRWKFDG